ncbi:MAG: hypothetical protein K8R68_06610 [Bacteroidales bacterium]|nr:hypothetical protein [Bacteroidales bacterium]
MVENGHNVAVMAYHNGDEYQNSYGNARFNYYGVTGIPTVKFDGVLTGGSGYANYLAKYNVRIAIPSSFTIDMDGSNSGMIDYEVELTIEKVAAASTDNLVLQVVLTESHIPHNWGGLSEVNFVERTMIPNHLGTTLDFSSNDTINITLNFSKDADWVVENCELSVFIQNNSTKEIQQAIKWICLSLAQVILLMLL